MIFDYLARLPLESSAVARREQIANNCVKPITLLIEAVELVSAAGPEEEAVLIHFIRSLYMQAETLTREKHFADLLHKLSACSRMH